MRTLTLLAAIFASCQCIKAQYMNFEWGLQTDSTASNQIQWFDVDPAGDIYMIQQFFDTIDVDPGPGTFTLAPQNHQGWAVLKISQSGNLIWARNFDQYPTSGSQLHVTSAGVIITGQYSDSVDLDPGAGQQKVYSDSLCGFIVALDKSGNYQWGGHLPSSHFSYLSALTVDENNNIWLAGSCAGITDLDQSSAINTVTVQTGESLGFILKMDQSGATLDHHLITTSGFALVRTISLDQNKNTVLAGDFMGTTDFDPGASTKIITALAQRGFVLKLDSLGAFQWIRNTAGILSAIADTDSSGNIYCAGSFSGTINFGSGTIAKILTAPLTDYYLLRLNSAGVLTWAVNSGSSCYAGASHIAATEKGDVYLSGQFLLPVTNGQVSGTMDLNHGPESQIATVTDHAGAFLIRTRTDGQFIWGGAVTSEFFAHSGNLDTDFPGEIYYHGAFSENADINPGPGIHPAKSKATFQGASYIGKLSTCDLFADLSPIQKVCAAQTITLNATSGTVNWYQDLTTVTLLFTGASYTLPPLATGHFSLAVENLQCSSQKHVVTVVVRPQPQLSISGPQDTLCAGEVATYSLQGAVSYSFNGTPAASVFTFFPNVQTQYSVQGISADGCIAEQTFVPPVEHCSSVAELSSATIRIYPNPAHDYFVVASPQDRTNLFLYDSQGAIVLECELHSGNNTISTGKLPKGIYFVMMAGEHVTPYRLLIQ